MKKTILFLVMSTLAVACAMDTGPERTGETQQALDNGGTPGQGESCHVTDTGVHDGTMKDGWCCGMAVCRSGIVCGKDYGKELYTCSSCDHYVCEPGATRIVIPNLPVPTATATFH